MKRLIATAVAALMLTTAASGQDGVTGFYSGRSMQMIIGYSPGGGYDQYARLVASHLGRFIPGNPEIVPINMPGAGGRVAAAYMFEVAAQDGTIVGIAEQTLAVAQATGDPNIKLDAGAFGYIGTPTVENNVFVTWHTSGVASVKDAREIAIPIGATGSTSSTIYPRIMNELLGTKFEIIAGYAGGNEINLAMENGEVSGRAGANWASLRPLGWLDQGLINIIAQIGLEREPDLPDVPLLYEFAQSPEDEQLLRLLSASSAMGRPFFTTPNVPEDRLAALRAAFDEMVADEAFLADAARQNLSILPRSGADLQQTVEDILSTPEEIGLRLGEMGGAS